MRNRLSPFRGGTRRTANAAGAALALTAALTLAACSGSDGSTAADPDASVGVDETTSAGAETTSTAPESLPPATATYEDPEAVTDITLDAPKDGATVSGSIDVSGTANSFEANVPWYLVDGGGVVTQQGAFTAQGWGDQLYPYSGSIDLTGVTPGDYTVVVSTDDPSDGEGKGPQQLEAHVTVE